MLGVAELSDDGLHVLMVVGIEIPVIAECHDAATDGLRPEWDVVGR